MSELQICQKNLNNTRIVETNTPSIGQGEILVKVDKFAFTANNLTYGVLGDQLGYWQFFPPEDNADGKWGIIPVWGFADVVESNFDGVTVGERLFGYFPPATNVKMMPAGVSDLLLIEGAAHRSKLPQGYNMYRRVNAEPGYNRDFDNERMLLFPLHITSFCIWDSMQDKDWYGAEQIIVISASSKTSLGLGYALDADENAPKTIGITSARNHELVDKLDIYDLTITYDDLESIDADVPTTIVDMSGNAVLLAKLHKHLADNMKHCINVGLTHWDESRNEEGIITSRSEFFFAPAHIQKRMKDWGPEGFEQKSQSFMFETTLKCRQWLKLKTVNGLSGLTDVYPDVCAGNIAAEEALIIQM